MNSASARARAAGALSAALATSSADGSPHVVPIVFAVDGDTIYSAVDWKPKKTRRLARLANIRTDPRVAVLFDHYDHDDWNGLWWVRADGTARIAARSDETVRAFDLLTARYPQYRSRPPGGPVIAVDVRRWTGWSAREG